eukprot:1809831-Pyramimonas_sp.AAC.1
MCIRDRYTMYTPGAQRHDHRAALDGAGAECAHHVVAAAGRHRDASRQIQPGRRLREQRAYG